MTKILKKIAKKILYNLSEVLFLVRRPFLRMSKAPILDFSFNFHSQNGEDGIVQELFRRLNILNGWAVEFGAWDGVYLSNTFRLLEKNPGFKAVYIEGDKARFGDLTKLSNAMPNRIVPICAFIAPSGEKSLDNLLKSTAIPKDFDLLSVDVDSIDYQIWQSLEDYKPKVVIIEVNSSIPPPAEQIHNIEQGKQGSSFMSTLRLGNQKGYTLLCHTGNMIFIRNDLLFTVCPGSISFEDQVKMFKT